MGRHGFVYFCLALAVQVIHIRLMDSSMANGQTASRTGKNQLRDGDSKQPRAAAPPEQQVAPPAGQDARRALDLRVVNGRTGRPEPGVSVELLIGARLPGNTDENGRYAIPYTAGPNARLVFNLNKPGFVPLQVSWDHFAGAARVEIPRECTIKLEPGSTIGGIVQDESGRPIAGADVRISVPTSARPRAGEPLIRINVNHKTRSDQAGRWKCNEVPDQPSSVTVSVSHANYVAEGPRSNISPFVRSAEKLAELREQKFVTVLKEGVTVRSLVRSRQGKPVEGVEVALIGSPIPRSAMTDAEGRFELAHLPDGDSLLSVRGSGYAPATQEIVAVPEMAPIEIELESGRTVSGRVVGRRGEPVPGVRVSFDPGDFEQELRTRPTAVTDGDGRFRLEVTDDPGSLVAHHQMVQATRLLSPSDTDVTIEIRTQPVIVRGEVTDSETGQPIPSFTVAMQGLMEGRRAATAGKYRLEWSNANLGLPGSLWVGIEADGYATSRYVRVPSPGDRDEVVVDFRLRRAAPITGVVRASDGSPLAGAEIAVSSPAQEPDHRLQFRIENGHILPNTDRYVPMRTDATGRFSLAAREGPIMMFVAHPTGFAIKRSEQLARGDGTPYGVVLEPWGRIEGTLHVSGRPAAGHHVSIDRVDLGKTQEFRVDQRLELTTDEHGRFVVEQVLPGMLRISHSGRLPSGLSFVSSPAPAFDVNGGQTVRLELGRTGRPVTGHLTLSQEIQANSSKRLHGSICSLRSEAGRNWTQEMVKTYRMYGTAFKTDGSFSADAVPPGNYTVNVTVYEQGPDRVIGTANHPIVVPAVPGASGYSEEPFDVGAVAIQPMPRLDVAQLAPDFEATTLEGKAVRLSQFRGKYVLIVFWSNSYRADLTLADSRNLRALQKTFGKLGRFVMLGISTDMEPDRLKNLLTQRGWDWLTASVPWDVWDKLLNDYSLPKAGSIWMIGRDGKVLARDLHGDAIKQVGTILLRAK